MYSNRTKQIKQKSNKMHDCFAWRQNRTGMLDKRDAGKVESRTDGMQDIWNSGTKEFRKERIQERRRHNIWFWNCVEIAQIITFFSHHYHRAILFYRRRTALFLVCVSGEVALKIAQIPSTGQPAMLIFVNVSFILCKNIKSILVIVSFKFSFRKEVPVPVGGHA